MSKKDSASGGGFGAGNFKLICLGVLIFMAYMKSINEKKAAEFTDPIVEQVSEGAKIAAGELEIVADEWKETVRTKVRDGVEPYLYDEGDEHFSKTFTKEQPPVKAVPKRRSIRDWATGRNNIPEKPQIKFLSWNLNEMGKSKNAEEIQFMANMMRNFDVVAVQEVVVSSHGARALGKLVDELNRTGSRWDYSISEPTTGAGSERYAYLWKTNKVKLASQPWLDFTLKDKVQREPFLARFVTADQFKRTFLCGNFHAVPKNKIPEKEVVMLEQIYANYPGDRIIIMGDFNLPQSSGAFTGLKANGFRFSMLDQPTTLKRSIVKGEYLHEPYDNILFERDDFVRKDAGLLDIVNELQDLRAARNISDHVPIYLELQMN